MILFEEDWAREGGSVHETTNKSFIRVAMLLKNMGLRNWAFPLAIIQKDLAKYDPHNLQDNSEELRLRIAVEAKLNPWYHFREVARIPASGSEAIPIKANRAVIGMIWCFYNNIHYIAIQPRQTGKAQPLNSLIKTPTGWTRMGDLKVGDVVSAPDGTSTNVIGVYPQGTKPIYRITFEDGRYADCCDEHLWKVYNRYWCPESTQWRVIPLSEIRKRLQDHPNTEAGLFVPLQAPAAKADVQLPLDPYVIGALLGDGGLSSDHAVYFTSQDDFIVDEIKRLVPDDVEVIHHDKISYRLVSKTRTRVDNTTPLLSTLRELNMLEKHSHTKSIPLMYMSASPAQKLALLQGLMDTDGTVDQSSSSSFCTTSLVMAGQVQYLVRSLGGICKIRERHPHYTHNGERREGRIAYQLNIRINDPKSLFRLPRKLDRLSDNYKSAGKLKLGIKSVEYLGIQEAQCIEVDHPDHLYITDNFVVTHNTIIACAILAHILYVAGTNITMQLYTKDAKLVQENVVRIKTMREALPNYFLHKQIADTDNKEGLSYTKYKNRYLTAIAQASKQDADNLGRGMTAPVIHIDEPGFCDNIDVTLPITLFSTLAAVRNAKEAGQPHSNIYTTTAAPIDTTRGRYTYDMVNKAMPMNEGLYDLKDNAAAKALIRANSKNDMINGTFSYLMLGYDRAWYEEACRVGGATTEVNERELLNKWTAGTDSSLLSYSLIKLINEHKHEPVYTEIIHEYIVRWYLKKEFVQSQAFQQHRYVLGMDSSENIGEDFTTLVMIDVADMSVAASFRCNESNTIKIAMFIAEFLMMYANVTFIPERNSTGTTIIDMINMVFQQNRINPFRRIYNNIVQNRKDPDMERINIDDPSILDTSMKKHLGFRTTGKTRPYLYKNTLNKAVSMNATRIHDITLIGELSTLAVDKDKGRIDHVAGGHDDMVIAYLLACWLIFFGENLQYYGINARSILTNVTADGTVIDPVHREKQIALRRQIKLYQDMVQGAPNTLIRNNHMQKLVLLQAQLDTSLTFEPIGVAKVHQDATDFGTTLYTPQEYIDKTEVKNRNGNTVQKLLRLFH